MSEAASRPSMRLAGCASGPKSSRQSMRCSGATGVKADEVGEDGVLAAAVLQAVAVADLAVAVAEGRVGELEGDDRRALGAEAAPRGVLDLLDEVAPHERDQEVLDDHPLVVPHRGAPGGVEALGRVDAVLAQAVDEPVVRADQAVVQLGDEDVHVVARVAEQRGALRVARHVAVAAQQLRRVARVVEEGRADRPGAVEALEVGPRRAEVGDRRRVGVRADGRAVGGDVVGDELPEEGPAGRGGAVVAGRVAAVAQPARGPEREQRRLV